jgi:hypothetical protein
MTKSIFFLSLLLLVACGNRTRLKINPETAFSQSDANVGAESFGFDEVFNKIIGPKCLRCHDNYKDYDSVAAQSDRLLNAIVSGRMPKGRPQLSTQEKSMFNSWVKQGSPLEAGGEEAVPIALEPSFKSIFTNVLGPKCLSCHNGSANSPAPTEINLSSYENIIESNNGYAEIFGDGFLDEDLAEDSEIVFLVTDTVSPMPPLVLPGNEEYNANPLPQLTDEEVTVLIEWIKKGFPND